MSPLEATLLTLTGIYLLNQCSILYQVHGVHVLEDIDAPAPPSWPSVSLIIPACNEESTIEEAMETLLAIDYPAIQILAINDRSTDATGEILDRIAGDHTKLEVVHVDALPEGWLGKVHAMHVGTQAATGDFLLYADADVHFGPTAIRKAVAWAERDAVDLVSLLPRLTSPTIAVGALVLGFGGAFFSTFKPRAINSDTPGAYGGIGAFNLVRKSTFEETEGWPWLRMEIADDVGLGLLLHRHGGRGRIGLAYEDLALTWYADVPAMVAGLEKNTFAIAGRFSALRCVLISLLVVVMTLSPCLILATPFMPVGLLALGAAMTGPLLAPRRLAMPWLSYLLSPLAGFVLSYIALRSSWATTRRGAVVWRGTQYDIAELRENQRVIV